jgi:hypothetical protein
MASFHHCIKSGKKGTAANHAAYISRKGKYSQKEDLVASGYGNMPNWAADNPSTIWKAGDKYERANGAVYREHEIALPSELTLEQNLDLVEDFIEKNLHNKPYHFAIHASRSSIQGAINTHVHLMFSDRLHDGIDRPPEQFFKRYNAKEPEQGGCRKDSGGKSPAEMREEIINIRKISAELQNAALERNGYATKVDHRSLKDQGIARHPEHHLGPARVQNLTPEEKNQLIALRKSRNNHS